jgi:hypothetical protein
MMRNRPGQISQLSPHVVEATLQPPKSSSYLIGPIQLLEGIPVENFASAGLNPSNKL